MFLVNKFRSEKGFTLIELMSVLFILSILIVPLFRTMEISYGTVNSEQQNQVKRESFRILTISLLDDLMFARNVHIENAENFDVLAYTSMSGERKTLYFDEELGITLLQSDGTKLKLAEGERYEENLSMVYNDNGIIRFNYYARELNILLTTSVKPRLIGGE